MTPERWEKVGEIFDSAAELNTAERKAYLHRVCADDPTLLEEVESLLEAEAEAGAFISTPIVGKLVPEFGDHVRALAPGNTVGHYKIEQAIGSGGMGEVYLATDTKLGRKVALKTLPPSFASDPSFLRRFQREAQAAANTNHPNIATVYAVEELEAQPFITMEYVDGQTLDRLRPEGGLELKKFLDWLEPIADALAHAHKRGITHRDIKPGNIMVSTDGTPKILDFGLAQIERSLMGEPQSKMHMTAPGQVIGTPSYMSPEQAEGAEVDARSDIFSFGTVMYEALTGKRPFRGASQGQIVRSVIYDKPEPIAKHRPDVPSVLARMIAKCLEKSPGKRFQSMREVRSILKEVRTVSGAGAAMDSFARRFYREAASPSKLRWAGFAVLVLVLALGGWHLFSGAADAPPFRLENISMRRLSQSSNVAFAAIAPDGRSVAYVIYEDNGDRSLWLRRISETNAIQVVPPQQVDYWDAPLFSRDGEYIYYVVAAKSATHGTMYRVPSLGGQPRKVVQTVNHLGNVSPDGRRVLFVRYGEPDPNLSVNTTDVRLLSANAADGSEELEHTKAEGETILREPRFSADGRSIFYTKRELEGGVEFWSIVMFTLSSGRETTLIRQKERINDLAVLQTTNGLLMNAVDPNSNRRQLFHVSVPDAKITRVTNDINSYTGVSVDREGRNIVSAQRTDEGRLWVGNSNDIKSATPLTREPLAHQAVDWTPDGRIVYDVYEDNRLSIWIADADGKNTVQLTPSNSDNSSPKVSGDGRYIVFTSQRAGYNQIWRMNIDGSGSTLLADVPGITQYPRFAANGKTVVFRWFNEGSAPMGQVDIDGGPVQGLDYLPRAIAYHWAMSPDGRMLAYTTSEPDPTEMRVIVRPVNSATPSTILDIWPTRIFKWTPDGSGLIYQERQRGEGLRSKVFRVDLRKPDQPKLLLATEPDEIYDFAYSPDQSRVAIVRVKTMTDAVMLTVATGP